MRALLGAGMPRGLQDFGGRAVAAVLDLIHLARELLTAKVIKLVVSFGVAPFGIAYLRCHPLS